MSAQAMLEQLLKSGISLFEGKFAQHIGHPSQASQHGRADQGVDQMPGQQPSDGNPLQWGQIATGGAVGGALGLLLGSKRGRKMGGKVLKYGGIAALGYAAYKTYDHWQAQQRQAPQAGQQGQTAHGQGVWGNPAVPPANPWPQALNPTLPAPDVEVHSRLMLVAMVAAAKADGHVDAQERSLIDAELQRQAANVQDRDWLAHELQRPLDPAEVAKAAVGPVQAAEMYLASLLVADDTSFMERAYLDELARQLRLPDSLKRDLEAQALNP